MKKLLIVDVTRTVSILVVLAVHLGCHYITKPSASVFLQTLWYRVWYPGGLGVTIFFVVSGFIITRLIATRPPGLFNPELREFYSRRAARILPLLFLACAFGIVMILFFNHSSRQFYYCFKDPHAVFSTSFWISIATFTFNWYKFNLRGSSPAFGIQWDMLWSLSVEEQFYLLYPLILKKLGTERRLLIFLTALFLYTPISNILLTLTSSQADISGLNIFAPYSSVAAGCLLYILSEKWKNRLDGHDKKNIGLVLSGLSIGLGTYFHHDYRADYWGHVFGYSLLDLGLFLFLLGGLQLDFFESRLWTFFSLPGKLCYGGYLLHPLALYFLWDFLTGMNDFLAFFTFAACTFIIAFLSYELFERPANSFLRKLLA